MYYLFIIGLKNVLRYKRRTILTSLVLSFGIMIFIFMAGMLKGFDNKSFENQIQFETGDFKIRSGVYDEDSPLDISNFLTNYREAEKILETKPYIKSFTERMGFTADLDNGKSSTPITVIAINPDRENSVFITSNFIVKGGLEKDGAILGQSLAKDMNVTIGDQVYVTFRNAQGTYDSVELNATGIINAPDPQVNNSSIYMNISDAQHYLNTDRVTEIVLKTADYRDFKKYEPDLVKSLQGKGMKVYDWEKLGQDFIAIGQAKSKTVGFLLFFIAIIAVIGIINTMLMSVFEKKREIGTMKALGMTDGDIRTIFVWEGLLIGIIGNIVGIAAGILLNLYFTVYGINITAMLGGNSDIDVGYKVMGVVKSGWDMGAVARAVLVSIFVSVAASYYPASKTTRLQPAECLRTIQ
ncbi:MAG: FtsX-like permease family protein [Brevinematales bacterium]|jgi:ABC-type lipoprotein release transport system permease subunit